jgi:hypothetical protein
VGRVVFTPKSEPAVDWSEIESRLQDISNSSPELPIEASAGSTIGPAQSALAAVSLVSHEDIPQSASSQGPYGCMSQTRLHHGSRHFRLDVTSDS